MDIHIDKSKRLSVIVNICFLLIALILMYKKNDIKNVHSIYIYLVFTINFKIYYKKLKNITII